MIDVDVLVIGGGLQGLLIADGLVRAGRSCVVISATDVGAGQTLHSHGVLNTGFGMGGDEPVRLLRQVLLPDLHRRGVATYGEWYAVMPPGVSVEDPVAPPPDLDPGGRQVRRLPEVNVNKVQLLQTLLGGLGDRVVRGTVVSVSRAPAGEVTAVEVGVDSGSRTLAFAPGAVVVAAGTGSKALLRVLGADEAQLEPIKHRRVHVLCVRGRPTSLPVLNLLGVAELVFVAAHHEAETLWYATPMDFNALHVEDVPGDASADVDDDSVASGWKRLMQLYPPLTSTPGLRFTAYAGYRQDIGDVPGVPMCARVDAARNVVAALPSGLIGAWPVARRAIELATKELGPSRPQPKIPSSHPRATIAAPNEDREGITWAARPAT